MLKLSCGMFFVFVLTDHICPSEGLIFLDKSSLIEIRLGREFMDAVHIYCVWGFEAPPGVRIVLRAKKYYRWFYDVEIGEGLDPFNASSVVRKLPFRGLDRTAHFSVTSSKMWVTLSRGRLQTNPSELDTMLDVFIVAVDGELHLKLHVLIPYVLL